MISGITAPPAWFSAPDRAEKWEKDSRGDTKKLF
jgi:hypothetical protein